MSPATSAEPATGVVVSGAEIVAAKKKRKRRGNKHSRSKKRRRQGKGEGQSAAQPSDESSPDERRLRAFLRGLSLQIPSASLRTLSSNPDSLRLLLDRALGALPMGSPLRKAAGEDFDECVRVLREEAGNRLEKGAEEKKSKKKEKRKKWKERADTGKDEENATEIVAFDRRGYEASWRGVISACSTSSEVRGTARVIEALRCSEHFSPDDLTWCTSAGNSDCGRKMTPRGVLDSFRSWALSPGGKSSVGAYAALFSEALDNGDDDGAERELGMIQEFLQSFCAAGGITNIGDGGAVAEEQEEAAEEVGRVLGRYLYLALSDPVTYALCSDGSDANRSDSDSSDDDDDSRGPSPADSASASARVARDLTCLTSLLLCGGAPPSLAAAFALGAASSSASLLSSGESSKMSKKGRRRMTDRVGTLLTIALTQSGLASRGALKDEGKGDALGTVRRWAEKALSRRSDEVQGVTHRDAEEGGGPKKGKKDKGKGKKEKKEIRGGTEGVTEQRPLFVLDNTPDGSAGVEAEAELAKSDEGVGEQKGVSSKDDKSKVSKREKKKKKGKGKGKNKGEAEGKSNGVDMGETAGKGLTPSDGGDAAQDEGGDIGEQQKRKQTRNARRKGKFRGKSEGGVKAGSSEPQENGLMFTLDTTPDDSVDDGKQEANDDAVEEGIGKEKGGGDDVKEGDEDDPMFVLDTEPHVPHQEDFEEASDYADDVYNGTRGAAEKDDSENVDEAGEAGAAAVFVLDTEPRAAAEESADGDGNDKHMEEDESAQKSFSPEGMTEAAAVIAIPVTGERIEALEEAVAPGLLEFAPVGESDSSATESKPGTSSSLRKKAKRIKDPSPRTTPTNKKTTAAAAASTPVGDLIEALEEADDLELKCSQKKERMSSPAPSKKASVGSKSKDPSGRVLEPVPEDKEVIAAVTADKPPDEEKVTNEDAEGEVVLSTPRRSSRTCSRGDSLSSTDDATPPTPASTPSRRSARATRETADSSASAGVGETPPVTTSASSTPSKGRRTADKQIIASGTPLRWSARSSRKRTDSSASSVVSEGTPRRRSNRRKTVG